MSVITDPQAMTTRFEGGALDVALNFPVTDFVRLQDDPDYTPYTFSAGNFSCLGVNCQVPPWDNKKARQALLYAVDRERWANDRQHGLSPRRRCRGRRLAGLRRRQGATRIRSTSTRPVDAQGRRRHRPFTGDVIMQNSNAELTSFAQILQSDFAKLGITLTLKPQDRRRTSTWSTTGSTRASGLGGGSFAQLDPATGSPRAAR